MASEAKHKAPKGTGLNILTLKQMLQRLPIAPGQVKAGNKIRNGEVSLAIVKNKSNQFKSNLSEVKKKHTKIEQKSKKTTCIILK